MPVFSMHGVLCHHAAVTRAPLVCTTWCRRRRCLVTGSSPLPILLLVSSHRSHHTDCTEVIAMVWATLDIELSAGVTNQDFSGIPNRLSCCCCEGRGLLLTPTPMRAECPLKLPEWCGASSPCRRHSPAENHEKGESLLQIKQLICMSHASRTTGARPVRPTAVNDISRKFSQYFCPQR